MMFSSFPLTTSIAIQTGIPIPKWRFRTVKLPGCLISSLLSKSKRQRQGCWHVSPHSLLSVYLNSNPQESIIHFRSSALENSVPRHRRSLIYPVTAYRKLWVTDVSFPTRPPRPPAWLALGRFRLRFHLLLGLWSWLQLGLWRSALCCCWCRCCCCWWCRGNRKGRGRRLHSAHSLLQRLTGRRRPC